MKIFASLFCGALLLASCQSNSSKQSTDATYTVPAAGTVVVADSMPVTDGLNQFNFSVKVITNANSAGYGEYEVKASVGANEASGQFQMPKGGKNLKPILRKDEDAKSYTIGFHHGNDTAFYEYYQVGYSPSGISMQYLKGYSFE
ncbi:hypothetical protein [Taibaiella soli]|uniref:Lipoprotein n=1 Tax=Taibaiella soli TaxID=1649169 RepID=A0A2W2B0N3_9BACT|nr:hypothetical protein [Taibaiella soli]PZF73824.1 hypothetical protein DN068_05635 [Taibaiella soli]